MQSKRKAVGGPPPRRQSASSYATASMTTQSKTSFNIGSKVIIQNSAPNFNGQVGIIKSKPNDTVYTIELLSDKKLVSAKLINMKLVDTTLQKLNLSDYNIGLEVKHLFSMLKENNTLLELDLSCNNIDDEGAEYLADMLLVNKTLQYVNLNGNNIGDKGVRSISASLLVNSSIKVIILSGNKISDEGAKYLADLLAINRSLQKIDLRSNEIDEYGWGAALLADALKCNQSIRTLHLPENNTYWIHKINTILEDPKRNDPSSEKYQSPLHQLELVIAKKVRKDDWIDGLEDKIVSLEEENDTLKESLRNDSNDSMQNMAAALECNDSTIKSFYLHGHNISKHKMERIKAILHDPDEDVVDLTIDDEPASKRQRTGDTLKSNLAIQHEQNQKIVQVKEEKVAAETALKDVREDLEDNQEDMGRQVLFTDFLQSKIDELAALAEAGGVDRARVAEIKSRSYSRMSS